MCVHILFAPRTMFKYLGFMYFKNVQKKVNDTITTVNSEVSEHSLRLNEPIQLINLDLFWPTENFFSSLRSVNKNVTNFTNTRKPFKRDSIKRLSHENYILEYSIVYMSPLIYCYDHMYSISLLTFSNEYHLISLNNQQY